MSPDDIKIALLELHKAKPGDVLLVRSYDRGSAFEFTNKLMAATSSLHLGTFSTPIPVIAVSDELEISIEPVIAEAVAAEREACARLVESNPTGDYGPMTQLAAAIRARVSK